jgi:hypothetical protein
MRSNVETVTRFTEKAHPRDEAEEYQAFSFGRIGIRPQMTLLVRKCTGEVEGFPYADYGGVSATNEDDAFSVKFGQRLVRIEGRQLQQLFRYVCNYRAAEITEVDARTSMHVAEDKAVVWRVTW